jgi:hypothetical protein
MFQVLSSISIQYIRFPEIITCSLNIIPIGFLSRIGPQGTHTIHEGRCLRGLYSIKTMQRPLNKVVAGMMKPSVELWHNRLGHLSFNTIDYVITNNELPFVQGASSGSVCDACQKAKSHQLSYKRSNSTSSHRIELVFLDVWGPAVESVGRYKYYESFIDDFSKFTWLYLIKKKSDVFQEFQIFQTHVER